MLADARVDLPIRLIERASAKAQLGDTGLHPCAVSMGFRLFVVCCRSM
jgi:hypothetical protein